MSLTADGAASGGCGRAIAPPAAVVEVFSGLVGFERLEPHWHRMLGAGVGGHLQRPERYRSYLEHLSPSPDSVHFLAVAEAGSFLLVLPTQSVTVQKGPVGLRLLQAPLHPQFSQFDAAYPGGSAALELALAALLQSDLDLARWDALHLRRIPPGSPLVELLPRLSEKRVIVRDGGAHAWFGCREEAEFRERYGGHFQRNLSRLRRRALQFGGLEVEVVATLPALERAFEAFVAVENASWKGEAGVGTAIASSPGLYRYYHTLVQEFGALGRCQINLLSIAGRHVAGQLCVRDGDRLVLLKIGYDQHFRQLAPGALLLDEILRLSAADAGVRRVDLMTAPAWAQRWAPNYEPLYEVWAFNRHPRARFGRVLLSAGISVKRRCTGLAGNR